METKESRSFLDKVWVESGQAHLALTQVYEGMRVYDRSGRKLGTVEAVYLGELAGPDAEYGQRPMTVAVRDSCAFSLIDDYARALTERVADPMRDRLLRHGFIRIESLRPFATDRYAMPNQIDRVSGDRVVLRVKGDELIKA
ncbi:MAG TPA: PRC-barrel domain-containing protein [Candidatus Tectomicrobia bacterium]|nr:PRC-barrel domain-containing protein [Candidatus Tectomicrobia bacterium]